MSKVIKGIWDDEVKVVFESEQVMRIEIHIEDQKAKLNFDIEAVFYENGVRENVVLTLHVSMALLEAPECLFTPIYSNVIPYYADEEDFYEEDEFEDASDYSEFEQSIDDEPSDDLRDFFMKIGNKLSTAEEKNAVNLARIENLDDIVVLKHSIVTEHLFLSSLYFTDYEEVKMTMFTLDEVVKVLEETAALFLNPEVVN